jgi:hypothetical protein
MTENDRIKQAKEWLETVVEKWMIKDINACIEGKANYTAALALSVYTEVLGGLITGNLEKSNKKNLKQVKRQRQAQTGNLKNSSKDNYKTFLICMGYSDGEADKIWRYVRCGFVHQYFIKKESTVYMKGGTKGIHIKNDRTDFYVEKYFQEFQDAYYKYKNNLLAGKEDLLEKLEEALSSKDIPSAARASKEGPTEADGGTMTGINLTTMSSSGPTSKSLREQPG